MQQLLIVSFVQNCCKFSFSFSSLKFLSLSLNLSLRRLTQVPNLGVSPRSWMETILLLSCQRVSDIVELENESKALFTLVLQIWFIMSVSRVHLEAFAQLLSETDLKLIWNQLFQISNVDLVCFSYNCTMKSRAHKSWRLE